MAMAVSCGRPPPALDRPREGQALTASRFVSCNAALAADASHRRAIASTTRLPSGLTSRQAFGPPSGDVNHCHVDVPPCATKSISLKSDGGSFQSLNVSDRHLTTDRGVKAAHRRRPPGAATFTSPTIRSIVAALTASNCFCSPSSGCNRPCRADAGTSVGIISLPHTRSDAANKAVSASLIVAP
jgi:hypothetical protein